VIFTVTFNGKSNGKSND